jgi:F-type H+-transporting ATPase subunit b
MKYRVGLAITIVLLTLLVSSCDAAQDLGINWHGLLGQFISFGVLLGLLLLFAYKPITRMLDERKQRIQEGIEQAEYVKEQTAKTEKLVQEHMAEARRQGQDVIAQAEQIGERLREEARQQAKQDAEAIVAKAQGEIQAQNEEAIAQLRREFVDVAIQAAEKVINKALDKETHRQLIEDTLKESTSLKKEG